MPNPVKADYTTSSLGIFHGNPLIEALPDYLDYTTQAIRRKLAQTPAFLPPLASRQQRCVWLSTLYSHLFVPVSRHFVLQEMVDMVIRQGYNQRQPDTPERIRHIQEAYNRMQQGEKVHVTFGRMRPDPLSLSVIGCSGIGKSVAVSRILKLYPQVIKHSAERFGRQTLQVTWLRIRCPNEVSIKSLCASIIEELDRVTGENYKETIVKPRTSIDILTIQLERVVSAHHVGILVIDDIQNLTTCKKGKAELLNFVVSLSKTLGVPVVYIGRPEIMKFMQTDLRTARHFSTLGTYQWERLQNNSPEWDTFVAELWTHNVLKDVTSAIPQSIADCLYDCSQGVVDILVKLYVLSQMAELVAESENLHESTIRSVFDTYFGSVLPLITAIRNNDPEEIEKLQDLCFPENEFQVAADELKEKVIQTPSPIDRMENAQAAAKDQYANQVVHTAELSDTTLALLDEFLKQHPDIDLEDLLTLLVENMAQKKNQKRESSDNPDIT